MSDHVFAIVGNPNCGKTTVYNALTGAKQRVGNWPGVTVERRSGYYQHQGLDIEVVDLPGTYCLDVVDDQVSMDERIARDFILEREAELVLNVLDASNIERNLYLTTQLLDMGLPVVVVLNMMDVAADKGMVIDPEALSKMLGCPVFTMVASKNEGVTDLKDQLNEFFRTTIPASKPLFLGKALEPAITRLENAASEHLEDKTVARWCAIKLLEAETSGITSLPESSRSALLKQGTDLRDALEREQGAEVDILIANGRYDAIGGMMKKVIKQRGVLNHQLSERIDRVVLNRFLGLPVFFGVMYLMFMFSLNFGSAFIDFFEILVGTIMVDGVTHVLQGINAPGWVIALLAEGVGGGIQTVATFIPVIAALFLFLSVLEDSGYMARAAFVMDRLMRFLGLPGKAFVPMLVGFGCNVPAIMATRTLDNQRDRLLTIAMAPFMSCGARLPVYALFAAAFFPATGQNVVFILYLMGILAAVATGLILKNSLLAGETSPFVLELPNYHLPSLKQVLLRTWDRLKTFILNAGKAIVLVVVVLNTLNSLGTDGSFGHQDSGSSMLSHIGQSITPAFKPMGIEEENWPAAVGIFTGMLAKEALVGTLNAMYTSIADDMNGDDGADESFDLMGGISEAFASIPENLVGLKESFSDPLGMEVGDLNDLDSVAEEQEVDMTTFAVMRNLFTSEAAVVAYLLFILLYTPCVAALGAIYREAGTGWTLFVAGWTFFVGYSVATLYYQLSLLAVQPLVTLGWVAAFAGTLAILFMVMRRMGNRQYSGQLVTETGCGNCRECSCS
ncbi:Fe(2+) transporter permease subunit FeoB [Endozoicomonas montiporae]|uniref:Ferrous iron transport protein B n=1 Tax=Endozoicomonas montiporae CL-33 TaxID=570277 RepID=A0A142BCH8_9GAMM|nr:Fe(2+) transporter permease subunit FeoB [Endozoicomonas montiporae]AMO56454.1 ferrous iron transport protein B [Endozoicomonas montiporae CL-33]